MKNFIITALTATLAFLYGIGWYYDRAVNDEEERAELMLKWKLKDNKAE